MLKKLILFTAPVLVLTGCDRGGNVKLDSDEAKVSYAIGMNIGRDFKRQGVEVKPEVLAAGISDALGEGETRMTDEEARTTLMEFQQRMVQQQQEKMTKSAEENMQKSQAFLDENKKKEGVQVTESGLQYRVIEEGSGPKPTAEDTVKVHYVGTLPDGTKFDSSLDRGEPAVFPVSGVIPGWTEALQMMPVGSKWELVIPPDLAYGTHGAGNAIGPNQALIFETELIEIVENGAGGGPGGSHEGHDH